MEHPDRRDTTVTIPTFELIHHGTIIKLTASGFEHYKQALAQFVVQPHPSRTDSSQIQYFSEPNAQNAANALTSALFQWISHSDEAHPDLRRLSTIVQSMAPSMQKLKAVYDIISVDTRNPITEVAKDAAQYLRIFPYRQQYDFIHYGDMLLFTRNEIQQLVTEHHWTDPHVVGVCNNAFIMTRLIDALRNLARFDRPQSGPRCEMYKMLLRVHAFIKIRSPDQVVDLHYAPDSHKMQSSRYMDMDGLNLDDPAKFLQGLETMASVHHISRPTTRDADLRLTPRSSWTLATFAKHLRSSRSSQPGSMHLAGESSNSDHSDEEESSSDTTPDLLALTSHRKASTPGQRKGPSKPKPRTTSSSSWGDADNKVVHGLGKQRHKSTSNRPDHMSTAQRQQLRHPSARKALFTTSPVQPTDHRGTSSKPANLKAADIVSTTFGLLRKILSWSKRPGQTDEDFLAQRRNYANKLEERLKQNLAAQGLSKLSKEATNSFRSSCNLAFPELCLASDDEQDEDADGYESQAETEDDDADLLHLLDDQDALLSDQPPAEPPPTPPPGQDTVIPPSDIRHGIHLLTLLLTYGETTTPFQGVNMSDG
eukprot:CAMPEP_0198644506 /NCGR_PEP_ID=MMETSP1467-20131203/661_1 /TAXON_ID=1462469 /ORGANISM="unid. sp., Strain CCMP2135" /LENGTH=594 /DNA_ID=CAMNT_0044379963 /DNA_START=252 /DNA_END=2033 /DNA_ORIENTATION=+